jgi:hypothetical protein
VSNIDSKPSPIRMIDSKGGAFGFDCCLTSPKFRVFQQPARAGQDHAAVLTLTGDEFGR